MEGLGQPKGANKASQQEGEFCRVWSGQTPAVCPHKGDKVHYLDQVHVEGEVNDRVVR